MTVHGPAPTWLAPLTAPTSWIYGAIAAQRRRRLEATAWTAPIPVVSVGNLTVGGTGKTPVVRWVVRQLELAGARPGIALRGFASAPGEPGDEAAEHAQLMAEVPIAAHPQRQVAIEALVEHGATVAVLDDGFQHTRVARDVDIVLIDGRRGVSGRVLPFGWQRERSEVLRAADAIVITHADAARDDLAEDIERASGQAPIAVTRHAWDGLRSADGAVYPLSWLQAKRVVLCAGVGQPDAVRDSVVAHGAQVVDDLRPRDHQKYDASWIRRMRDVLLRADVVLCTRKDWVKLQSLMPEPQFPLAWPELHVEFISGHDELAELVTSCV